MQNISVLFPSHENRTKIKCSTHKSVKKIARLFLSCNKLVLGPSSLAGSHSVQQSSWVTQCPSVCRHLLCVPLSLHCTEGQGYNTEENLDSGGERKKDRRGTTLEKQLHPTHATVHVASLLCSKLGKKVDWSPHSLQPEELKTACYSLAKERR